MSKIYVNKRKDLGAETLDFTIDGKTYVAFPKTVFNVHAGRPDIADQRWLDEFKTLLEFSSKYNLNPFATPVKADPIKSDKYKGRRSYDKVKYSWNKDDTIKGSPHPGLRDYIDVVPTDKVKEYLEKRRPPEALQTQMVLSSSALRVASAYLASIL